MSTTDELLSNNESYASGFSKSDLPMPPSKKVAVVACMDARLDPARALGLEEGDAHVIRNAGGVITDDEIRSLAISQTLHGTEGIILLHHTDCGMLTFTDDQLLASAPSGRLAASTISSKTSGTRSAGSRRAPSSATRTCGASSTRWRRGSCAK